MWRREPASQTTGAHPSRRRRRILTCAVIILAMAAVLLFGRGILTRLARHMAARRMSAGAIRGALRWLAWSGRLDPEDGKTELMRAACFRQLQQTGRWRKALESAERRGAPAVPIQQETRLGHIQSGQLSEGAENELVALIEAGVSPHEASTAFVHGYLARNEPHTAKMLLDYWAADFPEAAQVAYMTGVYWRRMGQGGRAQTEFEKALAREPRHELARMALAELFENQHRLDEALQQRVELASRFAPSETATLSLAGLLRKLGRLDEARAVLEPLASGPEPPSAVAVEVAHVEFESGNYQDAQRWFEQADLDRSEDNTMLTVAASAFALDGTITRAEPLFARVDAAHGRVTRAYDLLVRLALDPGDREAAGEVQRLSGPSTTASGEGDAAGTEPPGEDRLQSRATSGSELYALHCGGCHGAGGDGNGRAARHLFPKPRDLRTGGYRLVSTRNAAPTRADLDLVIRQGMPGTAMRSFETLSEDERKRLAEELLRIRREGIRDQFISVLTSEGEEIDEEEIRQDVERCTTPSEVVRVPAIGPPGAQAVVRGKEVYSAQACDNCHGDDGVGAPDTPLFDGQGRPTRPRDLAREPLKGGEEPESIYLRNLLGMPGTPHPASISLTENELIDLVHYCRSLSREPKRVLTNQQRGLYATGRAYLSAFGGSSQP